ncbi:restriction endonuclease subunit S [Helicobacter pylori]|uniref:restriction endonuclease subunit S n=1 Tax=Helicobacter pylori TaxID=210 RepID=UPI001ABA6B82|nr:restriction endonuclease subunit S [Helicobacter pylori]
MDALTTPSNWQRVRLGDICEITTGSLDANEMVHYGKYRFYTCAKEYYFIDKYAFDTEAILISGNGAYVGYVHYYKGKFNAYQRTYVLDNFSEHIMFVKYFLTMFLQSHIQTNRNEGNTPYIVMATLKDFEILLPPLNEQIAIANILSDVDCYLYSLRALILKKESVKKALSFELLSQRKRLKGFNQNWQRVRLGDVAEIKRGASPRPIENPKWFCANSNVGWVRISDISKNSRFLYKTAQKLSKKGIEKSRFIKQNSLIMSMCATIGKPIITKIDTCIHDGFVVFENPKIDLNYLYYFLCYIEKEWLESGQQGSQVNLNVDLIKNKEVFCPKDLNEQIAIANILSDVDNEIISLKNKKRQFDNIKKALNHDLMSAKIRVLKNKRPKSQGQTRFLKETPKLLGLRERS